MSFLTYLFLWSTIFVILSFLGGVGDIIFGGLVYLICSFYFWRKSFCFILVPFLCVFAVRLFLYHGNGSESVFSQHGSGSDIVGVVSSYRKYGSFELTTDGGKVLVSTSNNHLPEEGSLIRIYGDSSLVQKKTDSRFIFNLFVAQYRTESFNYDNWLFSSGYRQIMTASSREYISRDLHWIYSLKKTIRQQVHSSFSQKNASLLLGMLIGDVSGFTRDDYYSFIDSGLVHLVAVSGSNLAFIVSYLAVFFFFVPYYFRSLIFVFCVVWYTILCGKDSSLVRASSMFYLYSLSVFFGRGLSFYHIIQISWIGFLFLFPSVLLYDLGFLLSYSAVFGIAVSLRIIQNFFIIDKKGHILLTCLYGFLQGLIVSFVVLVFLSFPLLYFSGSINYFSFFGNILVGSVVPIITLLGSLFTFVSLVDYIHPLAEIIEIVVSFLLSYIRSVSSYLQTLPKTTPSFYLYCVLLFLCSIFWYLSISSTKRSRMFGFEPKLSASETDVLTIDTTSLGKKLTVL